jgi:hypothetical protein
MESLKEYFYTMKNSYNNECFEQSRVDFDVMKREDIR